MDANGQVRLGHSQMSLRSQAHIAENIGCIVSAHQLTTQHDVETNWKPGEIEPRTGIAFTHNVKADISPPLDDGHPSLIVIQWYTDGTVKSVYPPKYANGKFTVPPWIKK